MKTQLSSLDVYFLSKELSQLAGARIDNIYQIGERDLKISLRTKDGKKDLIITPTYACLTKYEHETPEKPSNFAMILRKLLGGGIIEGVWQHRFDRIMEIAVQGRGTLIIELFSRGNVIMAGEDGAIKCILESQEWKDRTLKPGLSYTYPPETPDVKSMNLHDFAVAMSGNKEIVKILATSLGLGATYANEALRRAGVLPDSTADKDKIDRCYAALKGMLESEVDASIIVDGIATDAVPFEMQIYGDYEKDKKPSFNETVDEYFTRIRAEGEKKDATKDYREEITRVEKVIEKQKATIAEFEAEAIRFKEAGDMIYSKFQEISAILDGVKAAKLKGVRWMEYLQGEGFKITNPADREFEFEGVGIAIDKSMTENASMYYDKSKKAKSKLEGAKGALVRSERELSEITEEKAAAEKKLPEGPVTRHRPEWYEKFRWFVSSDGYLVIGGRDATTNETLIKKHMGPNDLVFHSTVHGAPFFIIKNDKGGPIPQSTKEETAQAAASYSSAWGAGFGSADVYAITPEQVTKTANSGEYLSKGAFVIRGEREWFKGTPLRIGLGFRISEYALSIGGPEGAVKSQTRHYVTVGPGAMKSGDIAKQAKAIILRKAGKEDGQKIKKVIIGEIQRWIPAGNGMLIK